MKKIEVNLKVLLAITILLGLSLSIIAQPQPRQRQFQQRDKSGFDILNLTDEQKAEVKAIHLAQLKEIQPLKDEMSINTAKINALIRKDDANMKEIVGLVEANGKIQTQIQVKNIENKIKLRALLNDEQKVIFDSRSNQMQRREVMARRMQQHNRQGRSR